MTSTTRRHVTAAVLALGLLTGSVPLQVLTPHVGTSHVGAGIVQAKKHKKHKKHRRGTTGGAIGVIPPAGGGDPVPQFESVTRTFTHGDAVGIDTEGPSKNYPAGIVVDGLTGGTITDVNVRIPGFQHDFPDDVDMLLVGPQGQNLILMSDVGGGRVAGTFLVDLTIDDEAGAFLPGGGPLSNGAFRPNNVAEPEPDEFPTPAPAPSSASALSVFDGTAPNGTWNLFIVDDAAGDGGVLIGGWSLTITATVRV